MSDYCEEVGIGFIIIFVGISSFFLGKYSVLSEKGKSTLSFENNTDTTSEEFKKESVNQLEQTNSPISSDEASGEEVVASKVGKRYYPLTCAGASRISDKNKIFFASVALAEKAGLTLAVGCK